MSSSERPYDNLHAIRSVEQLRFFWAIIVGAAAGVAGVVVAIISFAGMQCVPLYAGFDNWEPNFGTTTTRCADDDRFCMCEMTVTPPENPVREDALEAEDPSLTNQLRNRWHKWVDFVAEFFNLTGDAHIARTARFAGILVVFGVTVFFFRGLLLDYYAAHHHQAQYLHFFRQRGTRTHLYMGATVALVAMLVAYLMFSLLWMFIGDMFLNLAINQASAILVVGVFAGLVGFGTTYMVVKFTTRRLVMFGIFAFAVGLSSGFAGAGQTLVESDEPSYWWQGAISTLGEDPNTDLLFMLTFVNLGLVFWLVWVDVGGFVYRALLQATPDDRQRAKRIFTWTRRIYFSAAVALISVGTFPFISSGTTATLIVTFVLHTAAAGYAIGVFIIGGMGFFTFYLYDTVFTRVDRWMAGIGLMLCGVTVGMFAIGIFNLTAMELVPMVLVCLWVYAAVDSLLYYSDLRALRAFAPLKRAPDTADRLVQMLTGLQSRVLKSPPILDDELADGDRP